MSHSQEPWRVAPQPDGTFALLSGGENVQMGDVIGRTKSTIVAYGIRKDDLERIAACFNACRGIPTEVLQHFRFDAVFEAKDGSGTNIDCDRCAVYRALQIPADPSA